MIETFLLLLTAHLLGDFVFQTDGLLQRKHTRGGMAQHILIQVILTLAFLAPTRPTAIAPIAIVAITHFLMDYVKIKWLGAQLWAFALDQTVHLAAIAALAVKWPEIAMQSAWGSWAADAQSYLYASLALLCGLAFGIAVGGVVIKKIVDQLPSAGQGSSQITGMRNAGRYIGWLERALAITFILIKQPEGVGLLLAAKSVLRFRDVQDEHDRHQAEYIIIGTFLSFGWAILTALMARAAMAHWLGR